MNHNSIIVESKNICIVEDDPVILETMQMILESEGYSVTCYVDAESIEIGFSMLPDLILIDYQLPKRNGDEVARNLKSKEFTKGIPIVLVSASQNIREIARDAGVDAYIEKPFDIDKLLHLVKKYTTN